MNHRSTSGAQQTSEATGDQELRSLRALEDPNKSTPTSTNDRKLFAGKCEPAVLVLLFGVLFTFLCVLLLGSSGGGTKTVFEHKAKQVANSTSSSFREIPQPLSPPNPPVKLPPLPTVPSEPPAPPAPPPTLEGDAIEIALLKDQLLHSKAMRAQAEAQGAALADENKRLTSQLAAKEEEMETLRSDVLRAVDSLFSAHARAEEAAGVAAAVEGEGAPGLRTGLRGGGAASASATAAPTNTTDGDGGGGGGVVGG